MEIVGLFLHNSLWGNEEKLIMWRDTGNAPYPDTIICKDEI
jgi:hypothetical protein